MGLASIVTGWLRATEGSVFTEHCGHSGSEKKTIHLRIYDDSLRDEAGSLVEGKAAADLKALIIEGIDTLIRLRSPNVIDTVDVKFGPWIPPAPEAALPQPAPFRMPWAELAAFVVGLAIAAAWIGAEIHLY